MAPLSPAVPTTNAAEVPVASSSTTTAPPPPPPTSGTRIRTILSHPLVSAPVFELAGLVADYIDGVWLSDEGDGGGVSARAVSLARRLLAYETDCAGARESSIKWKARASELEAQLLSLVGDAGGQTRLLEELHEARAANAAVLAGATGAAFEEAWEKHAGTLAIEAAELRATVLTLQGQLEEANEALNESRRVGPKTRPMAVGFEKDGTEVLPGAGEGVRSRRREETP